MAVCFCAAAFLFLRGYAEHGNNAEELASLSRRYRMLTEKQQELIRQQHLIAEMDLFIAKADAAGLVPDKWSSYNIDIEKPMSYELARSIIDQCDKSAFAYFKPVKLVARKIDENEETKPTDLVISDINITLNGQFIARQP